MQNLNQQKQNLFLSLYVVNNNKLVQSRNFFKIYLTRLSLFLFAFHSFIRLDNTQSINVCSGFCLDVLLIH